MVKQFSFTLDLSYLLDNIWDNGYLCQNTSDWLRISSIEIYHSAFKLSKCEEIDWYLKFPWIFFLLSFLLLSSLFIYVSFFDGTFGMLRRLFFREVCLRRKLRENWSFVWEKIRWRLFVLGEINVEVLCGECSWKLIYCEV